MALADDIRIFLVNNPYIQHINFTTTIGTADRPRGRRPGTVGLTLQEYSRPTFKSIPITGHRTIAGHRIYNIRPSDYTLVANAIRDGNIIVRTEGVHGTEAGASYDPNYDSLELPPGFTLTSSINKALIVHECTHAILDIRNFGRFSNYENEAIAYLAEAIFLVASNQPALGNSSIRSISRRIAVDFVSRSGIWIRGTDFSQLVTAISGHPHYESSANSRSDRFNRSLIHEIFRDW